MDFNLAFDPFRALQGAWRLLRRGPGLILVGGILLALTDGSPGWGFSWRDGGWRLSEQEAFALALIAGCVCLLGLAAWLFNTWLTAGWANSIRQLIVSGRDDAASAFDARGRFVDLLLARLLVLLAVVSAFLPFGLIAGAHVLGHKALDLDWRVTLALGIVAAVLYLPVLVYIMVGLMLVDPVASLEDLGAGASLRRSWQLARGRRLRLLIYFLVLGIFSLLGLCLCCVGVLFTTTLSKAAVFESYLAWTRPDERALSWISVEPGVAPVPPAPGAPAAS